MPGGFIPRPCDQTWQRPGNWRNICSAAICRSGLICGRFTGKAGLVLAIKRTLKRLRKFSVIWVGFGLPLMLRGGPPGAPGRAPSPTFEINPRIFETPLDPTDTTDTIKSGSSVSDPQGTPKYLRLHSVSSVSDHEGVSEKSEASDSADHPQSSEHPSTPTDKTDTIPEQKRVGWV